MVCGYALLVVCRVKFDVLLGLSPILRNRRSRTAPTLKFSCDVVTHRCYICVAGTLVLVMYLL